MIQWAIELSKFDIEYHPKTPIKVQELANFEFIVSDEDEALDEAKRWTIQIDESLARKRGGLGVIIITPEGETLKYEVQLMFLATKNEAEYEAILTGLRVKKALGSKNLLL